jgi:hypothetical protein
VELREQPIQGKHLLEQQNIHEQQNACGLQSMLFISSTNHPDALLL